MEVPQQCKLKKSLVVLVRRYCHLPSSEEKQMGIASGCATSPFGRGDDKGSLVEQARDSDSNLKRQGPSAEELSEKLRAEAREAQNKQTGGPKDSE